MINEIAFERLANQGILGATFKTPEEVVKWLGAVQAQDFLGSLWAIGLRMKGGTEAGVEQAIAKRTIVRSWPMRGTLHFVPAQDIRWMLKLLAPRIIARCAGLYKQSGLDKGIFLQSKRLFSRVLEGGNQLTRKELYEVLERSRIATGEQRGLHILANLAQQGVICFGPRKGKQQTFVLLDEWVPPATPLAHDEALSEITRRYFRSHGPASLMDFIWWSGLTKAEAKRGLEMVRAEFVQREIKHIVYWASGDKPILGRGKSFSALLPAYDEYTVGYKDRSAILNPLHATKARNGIFSPVVVVNGQVLGTWKRTIKNELVYIGIDRLGSSRLKVLPLESYSAFLGKLAKYVTP